MQGQFLFTIIPQANSYALSFWRTSFSSPSFCIANSFSAWFCKADSCSPSFWGASSWSPSFWSASYCSPSIWKQFLFAIICSQSSFCVFVCVCVCVCVWGGGPFCMASSSVAWTLSSLLALCERNPPWLGGYPLSKVKWCKTLIFYWLFVLKKLFNKQSLCQWFEMPCCHFHVETVESQYQYCLAP